LPFELRVIVERDRDLLRLTVEQEIGDTAGTRRAQSIFEFPLRSRDGTPGDGAAKLIFGQQQPEP
jgi:hypothetical protein